MFCSKAPNACRLAMTSADEGLCLSKFILAPRGACMPQSKVDKGGNSAVPVETTAKGLSKVFRAEALCPISLRLVHHWLSAISFPLSEPSSPLA